MLCQRTKCGEVEGPLGTAQEREIHTLRTLRGAWERFRSSGGLKDGAVEGGSGDMEAGSDLRHQDVG